MQTAQVFSNGLVSYLQSRDFLFETFAVFLGTFVPECVGLSRETDCDCPRNGGMYSQSRNLQRSQVRVWQWDGVAGMWLASLPGAPQFMPARFPS